MAEVFDLGSRVTIRIDKHNRGGYFADLLTPIEVFEDEQGTSVIQAQNIAIPTKGLEKLRDILCEKMGIPNVIEEV